MNIHLHHCHNWIPLEIISYIWLNFPCTYNNCLEVCELRSLRLDPLQGRQELLHKI